jgi:putative tryptophan/tyrosine transport system substrate-binding protein
MASYIGRRKFLATLGGAAAAWPLAARAQQGERMRHIGVLMNFAESDPEAQQRAKAFESGLQELGWSRGRNVKITYRWVDHAADLPTQAAELIAAQPELILASTTPALTALRQETRTIPIVFVQVHDPVAQGFVPSLTHPGGNITGFSAYESSIGGKWLELLKEVAPRVVRVGLLFNPKTTPYADYFLRSFETAAFSFAAAAIPTPVHDTSEVERVVTAFAAEANTGLITLPDAFITVHRDLFISLAARHRLPAVYPFRYFAVSGGLLSYGIEPNDVLQRAATYVDRILKGAKPAELPVQLPNKYTLVVNLNSARALGLEVPPTLLVRADEVIE